MDHLKRFYLNGSKAKTAMSLLAAPTPRCSPGGSPAWEVGKMRGTRCLIRCGPRGSWQGRRAHRGSQQVGHEAGLTALCREAAATKDEEPGRTGPAVFSKLTLSRLNFIPSK